MKKVFAIVSLGLLFASTNSMPTKAGIFGSCGRVIRTTDTYSCCGYALFAGNLTCKRYFDDNQFCYGPTNFPNC